MKKKKIHISNFRLKLRALFRGMALVLAKQ